MRTTPDERPVPTEALLHKMLHRLRSEHPGLDVEAAELGDRLWSHSVRLVRAFEAHVQQRQMTMARFGVLLNLLLAPGHRSTPSKISEGIHVSRPTMTGVIEGLVKARLVRRVAADEDRRNQYVELTAEGLGFIERAAPEYFGHLAAAVLALDPKERAVLRSSLELLRRVEAFIADGVSSPEPTPAAKPPAQGRRQRSKGTKKRTVR